MNKIFYRRGEFKEVEEKNELFQDLLDNGIKIPDTPYEAKKTSVISAFKKVVNFLGEKEDTKMYTFLFGGKYCASWHSLGLWINMDAVKGLDEMIENLRSKARNLFMTRGVEDNIFGTKRIRVERTQRIRTQILDYARHEREAFERCGSQGRKFTRKDLNWLQHYGEYYYMPYGEAAHIVCVPITKEWYCNLDLLFLSLSTIFSCCDAEEVTIFPNLDDGMSAYIHVNGYESQGFGGVLSSFSSSSYWFRKQIIAKN